MGLRRPARGVAAAGALAAVCAFGAVAPARAAVVTVAGVTFDTASGTTTLEMISGVTLGGDLVTTGYATPFGPALWSGSTRDFPVAGSLGAAIQRADFQPGYDPGAPVPGGAGASVTIGNDPDIAGTTHDREILRLTWGAGNELTNHASSDGPQFRDHDLVVFEQATTEAFAVRVRNATASTDPELGWTSWFYTVAESAYDAAADATPTLIDLSDLGIPLGDVIDMIEITNLTAADKTLSEILGPGGIGTGFGHGEVVFNGSGELLAPGRFSESSGVYKAFESFKFNPDLQYVAGLHNLNNPGTQTGDGRVPEPATALLFAAAALGLLRRARRVGG